MSIRRIHTAVRLSAGLPVLWILILCMAPDATAQQPGDRQIRFLDSSVMRYSDRASSAERDTVPIPRDVMFQSMILPGWGQYTNRQIWKIPIIYGLMGGLTYYAFYADEQYRGYRAAFYNSFEQNDDFRFGPTPGWIDPNTDPEFLRANRNFFRNRRDFLIITVVLSYALNVLDAYIFAHMRDFDVSDDLSAAPGIDMGPQPLSAAQNPLNLTFRIRF